MKVKEFFKEEVKEEFKARISWSQVSMFLSCPHRWELNYARKMRKSSPSIHLVFGTAFHETMQSYIQKMYDKSIKEADEMDLGKILEESMRTEYTKMVKANDSVHFSSVDEMREFYIDGMTILEWFKKNRGAYFSKNGYKLLGIETPLKLPASPANKNVWMIGFIDLVIEDVKNKKIIIYDIKTSTRGWNKYQKIDPLKTNQLVLYKEYYARQYGYDVEDIEIKFFIVKRKLYENCDFPQRRVQEFAPSSGKVTRNRLLKDIDLFISLGFKEDGSYNLDHPYPAMEGKNKKNCKWCEWANDEDKCPAKNRIKN